MSDREPMFSVVIPTFNREKLLSRCLQSVLGQSFRDFEVVVADDGSNDGSRAIVDEHVRREPRLRYVFQENKGAGDQDRKEGHAASQVAIGKRGKSTH